MQAGRLRYKLVAGEGLRCVLCGEKSFIFGVAMSWKVDVVVVGPIQCNCYILLDETSRKAILIDPGAESPQLLDHLQKRKLDLVAVLITHAHVDHVGGIEAVYAQTKAP